VFKNTLGRRHERREPATKTSPAATTQIEAETAPHAAPQGAPQGSVPLVARAVTKTPKGEQTRERVLDTALALFRKRGFEATTMRDVAAEAGLSLGAAYHYFASKEAIVLAYYERVQDAHGARMREAPSPEPRARGALRGGRLREALSRSGAGGAGTARGASVRERLGRAVQLKLEILEHDRPLMGALLRYTGDAAHPLSFLGEGTRDLQLRSMAVFADALDGEPLPEDLQALAPLLAWALHMGLLLYFLYDDSPGHTRTMRLAAGAVDLFATCLTLAKLPILRPVRRRVVALLSDAGLVPAADAIARHRHVPQPDGA